MQNMILSFIMNTSDEGEEVKEMSKHYSIYRNYREKRIAAIGGLGKVVFREQLFDAKRQHDYIYEITNNSILSIYSVEVEGYMITRMIAKPKRILQYWENCPKEILEKSARYAKDRNNLQ